MKSSNLKSVVVKSLCIVSFIGVVVFSNASNVLAANAIVTSDPALNFDNNKLQVTLTEISNKSDLGVVFYSNNTFSPNTVQLPNDSTVNKAIYLNDSFIPTIKSNKYITLFYNRDSNNLNKGSFSVNVGADYRDVISKEYIKENIVDPN